MTTIKLLSTGLIAIAMLTTTAVARENFAAGRTRVIIRGAPCYMGIWQFRPRQAAGLSGTAFQYGSVRRSGACPATFATRATMRGYAEMRRIGGAPPTAAAPPRSTMPMVAMSAASRQPDHKVASRHRHRKCRSGFR